MKRAVRIRRARAVRWAEQQLVAQEAASWRQLRERLLYPRTHLARWFLRALRRL